MVPLLASNHGFFLVCLCAYRHLQKFNVEYNLLSGLPASILSLSLTSLSVDNNYFHPALWQENARNQPQVRLPTACVCVRACAWGCQKFKCLKLSEVQMFEVVRSSNICGWMKFKCLRLFEVQMFEVVWSSNICSCLKFKCLRLSEVRMFDCTVNRVVTCVHFISEIVVPNLATFSFTILAMWMVCAWWCMNVQCANA